MTEENSAEIALPPKLRPVFAAEGVRYRGAFGGRGSGKTRSFAKMAAVLGYVWGKAGRSGNIVCCREFMNSLADSSMEEIKAAIEDEAWLAGYYEIGESYIRSRDGRIKFLFIGLKRNINSIKSKARILLCWVDEAEDVGEESWAKLTPTVREAGSEIWVTWNPESKRSATHKRFRESRSGDMMVVECNWRDNPWFPDVLERERRNDLTARPDQYEWVWEGGFRAFSEGAYYVRELTDAREAGRICGVAPDPALKVHTAWDLGIGDSTAIWLWQAAPGGIRVIDYIEDHGHGLPHYAALLKGLGHDYGIDFVPHDARARELGTGRTRVETMVMLGRSPKLVPMHTVDDGINAVREVLPRMWFDEAKCEAGLDALREYRTEYVDDIQTFKPRPLHNWASHGADAMRYLAVAYRDLSAAPKDKKPKLPNGAIALPPPPAPSRSDGRINL